MPTCGQKKSLHKLHTDYWGSMVFVRSHFLFPEIDVAFMDIKKNASTNVKRAILDKLSGEYGYDLPDLVQNPHIVHHSANPFRAKTVSQLEGKEIIVIFRDPADRLVSAYCNKFIKKDTLSYALKISKYKSRQEMVNRFTFEQFCQNIFNSKEDTLNIHWRSQHITMIKGLRYKIFDFKDMQNSKELSKSLKVNLYKKTEDVAFANSSPYSNKKMEYVGNEPLKILKEYYKLTDTVPNKASLVSDEMQEKIKQFYKKDYEIYDKFNFNKEFYVTDY